MTGRKPLILYTALRFDRLMALSSDGKTMPRLYAIDQLPGLFVSVASREGMDLRDGEIDAHFLGKAMRFRLYTEGESELEQAGFIADDDCGDTRPLREAHRRFEDFRREYATLNRNGGEPEFFEDRVADHVVSQIEDKRRDPGEDDLDDDDFEDDDDQDDDDGSDTSSIPLDDELPPDDAGGPRSLPGSDGDGE